VYHLQSFIVRLNVSMYLKSGTHLSQYGRK
jgi:hypothetical protein